MIRGWRSGRLCHFAGAGAAAVLGGTSLFGGRGSVLPGALLGALMVRAVETGLVMTAADPYSYPVVIGGIIFVTVLIDRLRQTVTRG